jgi:hypothetical protein
MVHCSQHLRNEICQQLSQDINLMYHGQLVFDDCDIGDDPLFGCIELNEESIFPPLSPSLTYKFMIPQHGLMTFEPASPISIEFAQRMFAYLTESQFITFSLNGKRLGKSEILPQASDIIEVSFSETIDCGEPSSIQYSSSDGISAINFLKLGQSGLNKDHLIRFWTPVAKVKQYHHGLTQQQSQLLLLG